MTAARFLPNARAYLPFSSGAIVGEWVILSGEIGIRADDTLPEGLAAQAGQALANIEATLARAGGTRADIVKCTIMLRDMSRWPEFNLAYLRFFDGLPLPARSAFGVAGLALDAEVEIECVAIVREPRAGFGRP